MVAAATETSWTRRPLPFSTKRQRPTDLSILSPPTSNNTPSTDLDTQTWLGGTTHTNNKNNKQEQDQATATTAAVVDLLATHTATCLTLVKTGRFSTITVQQPQQQEEKEAPPPASSSLTIKDQATKTPPHPHHHHPHHLHNQAPSPYGDPVSPQKRNTNTHTDPHSQPTTPTSLTTATLTTAATSPSSSLSSCTGSPPQFLPSATVFFSSDSSLEGGREEEKGHSPRLEGEEGGEVSAPSSPRAETDKEEKQEEDSLLISVNNNIAIPIPIPPATTTTPPTTSTSILPPPPLLRRRSSGTKMFLPHEASELEQDIEEEEAQQQAALTAAAAAARLSAGLLARTISGPTPPPPTDDRLRIHQLTLKEIEQVDENPAALLCPTLSLPSVAGTVAQCQASYGKAGRAKAFRGPAALVKGPVILYGEDVLAEAELLLPASVDEAHPHRPKWVRALGVFDGHGMHGKDAARLAAERFIDDMRRTTMQTLNALLQGDINRVKHIEHERFRLLDAHLETELRSPTGGTTCSTVQFHTAVGKSYMVVSNVGDSPVVLINNKTGAVRVLTGRHSWDNPDERQKYIDRCLALGLTPRDVVYGRINCGGMRLEDAQGGEEPFCMYLPGSAEICTKTRDHLCKQVEKRFRNSIGGSQSIRRFIYERQNEQTGEWEVFRALEEHAHVNWGATILVNHEGKIQMSRSLGDSQEKLTAYIWAEPDVSVYEFQPGEDWTVVACSDGVSDVWYFHELGELAARYFVEKDALHAQTQNGGQGGREGEVQELAQLILDQTIERGEATPGYGVGPRMSSALRGEALKRPLWDDLSVQCARIQT